MTFVVGEPGILTSQRLDHVFDGAESYVVIG